MLTFLLIASAVQLAAACGCFAATKFKSSAAWFWSCGFLSLLFGPLLVLQFLVLMTIGLISGLVCRVLKVQPRYYRVAGALATAAIFLGFGLQGPAHWATFQQLFPVESLEDRLAYETSHEPAGVSANEGLRRGVAELDELFADPKVISAAQRRAAALSIIHGSYVKQFVNSPGFGVGRDFGSNSRIFEASFRDVVDRLHGPVPMSDPLPLAAEGSAQHDVSQARDQVPQPAAPTLILQLETVHRHAQLDFSNPTDFGFMQDRAHVVGFRPHRFTRLPAGRESHKQDRQRNESWETRRVELVSLLKHERPMVYLSKHLPRMDELRGAAVRPLDAFEEEGLAALRLGETILTRDEGDRIRMLGAVRAATQCLNCHEVQHGALLGAFSYEFGSLRPLAPAGHAASK